MKIYPKTSETLQGFEYLKQYIEKSKGVEVQLLSSNDTQEKTADVIKQLKNEIPSLKEIIIHLPLTSDFDFECLAFSNIEIEKERLKMIVNLSKEYNLHINLLYHTTWEFISWINSGAIDRMKELLAVIHNTNVNILIENIFSMVERKECTVLKIAKEINDEQLRVCIDICHLHVVANIFKTPFHELLSTYLNKEDCEKYVQQIHFAGTLNEDGFIDKKTHGRVHDSWESFEEDYNILKQFGIEDKKIITEVSEDDYLTRKDQIIEIKYLLRKEENLNGFNENG